MFFFDCAKKKKKRNKKVEILKCSKKMSRYKFTSAECLTCDIYTG